MAAASSGSSSSPSPCITSSASVEPACIGLAGWGLPPPPARLAAMAAARSASSSSPCSAGSTRGAPHAPRAGRAPLPLPSGWSARLAASAPASSGSSPWRAWQRGQQQRQALARPAGFEKRRQSMAVTQQGTAAVVAALPENKALMLQPISGMRAATAGCSSSQPWQARCAPCPLRKSRSSTWCPSHSPACPLRAHPRPPAPAWRPVGAAPARSRRPRWPCPARPGRWPSRSPAP